MLHLQCSKSQQFSHPQQTIVAQLISALEDLVLYLAALQNLDLLHPLKRRMQPFLRRIDWLYDDVRSLEERLDLEKLDETKLEDLCDLISKFKIILLEAS